MRVTGPVVTRALMRREHQEAWHERVCQGLEGEALELTLWVRGCGSPALSPRIPAALAGLPISLVVGPGI